MGVGALESFVGRPWKMPLLAIVWVISVGIVRSLGGVRQVRFRAVVEARGRVYVWTYSSQRYHQPISSRPLTTKTHMKTGGEETGGYNQLNFCILLGEYCTLLLPITAKPEKPPTERNQKTMPTLCFRSLPSSKHTHILSRRCEKRNTQRATKANKAKRKCRYTSTWYITRRTSKDLRTRGSEREEIRRCLVSKDTFWSTRFRRFVRSSRLGRGSRSSPSSWIVIVLEHLPTIR